MLVNHLLKKKQIVQNRREAEHWRYIYQSEQNKACFQQDMIHEDFKGLPRTRAFDKVLRDK